MPQVIAEMATSAEEIDRVVREHGILFLVLPVQSALMSRMADGIIRSKDAAKLPLDLIERLKNQQTATSFPSAPAAAMLRQELNLA